MLAAWMWDTPFSNGYGYDWSGAEGDAERQNLEVQRGRGTGWWRLWTRDHPCAARICRDPLPRHRAFSSLGFCSDVATARGGAEAIQRQVRSPTLVCQY